MGGLGSALFIRVPLLSGGRDQVIAKLRGIFHPAKQSRNIFFRWKQARHGATPLSNDDFFPAALNFIQKVEALRFELARANMALHTVVI